MLTASLPDTSSRTVAKQYSRLAFGYAQANNFVQVLGVLAGKNVGEAAVAAVQSSSSPKGSWIPSYVPLATLPVELSDLVVCTGYNVTDAIGLGIDGQIYRVGAQAPTGTWSPGAGLLAQPTTFVAGSLSFQLINTSTVFALSSGAPWVAAYRSQAVGEPWQPGYALPSAGATAFRALAARPDMSSQGTTHAIGISLLGQVCEVATAQGPGTGAGNWTAGKGLLGGGATLPAFRQVILVSGDSAGTFHVIGLGTDGSVWDVDQFATTGSRLGWQGTSTMIAMPNAVASGRIDYYLTTSGASITINLVAASASGLRVFAQFGASGWSVSSIAIPTSGMSTRWQLVNNLAAGTAVLALGLSGPGLVYELAYFDGATWTAGTAAPING